MKQWHWGNLAALFSGASLPLAFAPFSYFLVAPLALMGLFIVQQRLTPRRAFIRGWLFGIGFFGVGVSWVIISFYRFGNIPFVLSLGLTIGFVMVLALYIGLFSMLIAVIDHRLSHSNTPFDHDSLLLLVVVPSLWTLIEWWRGWFLTGFPWLSIGYSQIDSPLRGFAPLIGVYGLTWLVALSPSCLLLIARRLTKLQSIRLRITQPIGIISVLLLGGIWTSGSILTQMTWTQAVDRPLTVVLLQGNVPQEFKFTSGYQEEAMLRYIQMSRKHRDVDLIVWPETAITFFYHEAQPYLSAIEAEHFFFGTDFLVGIPVLNQCTEQYFNAVVSLGSRSGYYPMFYCKNHLVPFGEYIPFYDSLGNLMRWLDVPLSMFSPGEVQQAPLMSAGQPFGVSICYEDAYSERVRSSLPQATLLVNVSNDAWFGDSIAPPQHLEIARMRALESERYLLRATNTGISAVINEQGQITAQAPQFQIYALRTTAQPRQGATPYVRWGDKPIIILLFLFLSLGLILRYHQMMSRRPPLAYP